MDDVGAIDQSERLADIVVGDQHADPAAGEVPDQLLNVGNGDRVDAGEGFVEQHEVGTAGQRPGDLQPAALATRQGDGGRLAQVADVEFLEQRVEFAFALLPVLLDDLEHRADVGFHRQPAKDRRFLRQVADAEAGPPVHRHGRDVEAVDLDRALVDGHQAGHHVEAGGLARAVGPEQADGLARAYADRDPVHHLASAIALRQAARDQRALQPFVRLARLRCRRRLERLGDFGDQRHARLVTDPAIRAGAAS